MPQYVVCIVCFGAVAGTMLLLPVLGLESVTPNMFANNCMCHYALTSVV